MMSNSKELRDLWRTEVHVTSVSDMWDIELILKAWIDIYVISFIEWLMRKWM